jgi:hypothetical protein
LNLSLHDRNNSTNQQLGGKGRKAARNHDCNAIMIYGRRRYKGRAPPGRYPPGQDGFDSLARGRADLLRPNTAPGVLMRFILAHPAR